MKVDHAPCSPTPTRNPLRCHHSPSPAQTLNHELCPNACKPPKNLNRRPKLENAPTQTPNHQVAVVEAGPYRTATECLPISLVTAKDPWSPLDFGLGTPQTRHRTQVPPPQLKRPVQLYSRKCGLLMWVLGDSTPFRVHHSLGFRV